MNNFSKEYESVIIENREKITMGEIWQNQPPVMNWCLGLTCLSFGFVYMLLFTML